MGRWWRCGRVSIDVAEELVVWSPERAAEVTGLDPGMVRAVARGYATESPAAIIMGGGS